MTADGVRRLVYTTNFGGYEQINDDQAESPSVRFLCYTDMPDLRSDRWEIRLVKPAFPLDAVRSQRIFKIRGDEALDGYDEILYIDNCISLRTDVSALFDEWLATADIAFMLHSFRRDVAAEFAEIVRTGLDDAQRVFEQFDHYAATQPEVLGLRPLSTGFFARRPTPEVNAALTRWLDHVLRYSRRAGGCPAEHDRAFRERVAAVPGSAQGSGTPDPAGGCPASGRASRGRSG